MLEACLVCGHGFRGFIWAIQLIHNNLLRQCDKSMLMGIFSLDFIKVCIGPSSIFDAKTTVRIQLTPR